MEAKTILYLPEHIVENIMKYLSIRDLRTCQKLCWLWDDLATREIYRRQYFVLLSYGPYCPTHHSSHPNKCEYNYPPKLSENTLSEYMKRVSAVSPQMYIIFVMTGFSGWYETESEIEFLNRRYESEAQQYAKMLIRNTLMRHLPREAILQLFVTNGIVSWSNDGVPLETEDGYGMSGVIIPDDPELKIYSCGPEDIYESKQDNLDKCSLLKRIPKDVDIKCLLLFADRCDLFRKYMIFAEACQDRQSTTIAVGGLRVPSTVDTNSDSEIDSNEFEEINSDSESDAVEEGWMRWMASDSDVHSCQVIAFCGERVEAASVTIYALDSQETVEENLSKFREIRLRKKKCLAFMFRNSTYGSDYYDESNYESSIFHRLYPDVPLIGAFGKGIIGSNVVPNVAVNSLFIADRNTWKLSDVRCYVHKTVFLFIAI